MSSYVCPPTHFAAIRTTLRYMLQQGGERDRRALWPLVLELQHSDGKSPFSDASELVNDWHELNMDSVAIQYRENRDKVADLHELQQANKPGEVLDLGSLYNALRCLLYQIEVETMEGMRPLSQREKQAMDLLERTRNAVAYVLAESSSEHVYARYSWTVEPSSAPKE